MLRWDATLELGHRALDKQHRKLARLINQVHRVQLSGPQDAVLAALGALAYATARHFEFEEQLMAETNYTKTEAHTENHSEILTQLTRFAARLLARPEARDGEKTLAFLKAWLASHIKSFDRDFVAYLATTASSGGSGSAFRGALPA